MILLNFTEGRILSAIERDHNSIELLSPIVITERDKHKKNQHPDHIICGNDSNYSVYFHYVETKKTKSQEINVCGPRHRNASTTQGRHKTLKGIIHAKDEFTNQNYKTFEEIWLHEIVSI